MQKNVSHRFHPHDISALKSYIKNIDTTLNRLHHAIGTDLKNFESNVNKGNGAGHKRYLASAKIHASHATNNAIPTQLLNAFFSSHGGGNANGLTPFINKSYQASTKQLWSEIASGISKAIQRNM